MKINNKSLVTYESGKNFEVEYLFIGMNSYSLSR
nr:MAG TPA: hypothetical protein [Caudoviricetes sp.]